MTPAQKKYKKQLIQKIQITKHNVFGDDEERKAFMESRFGADSTTKLNIDQLKLLLDFCNKKVSDIPVLNSSTVAQREKIIGIWLDKARDRSFVALFNFIKRITNKEICDVQELTQEEATKVIVALENFNTKEKEK